MMAKKEIEILFSEIAANKIAKLAPEKWERISYCLKNELSSFDADSYGKNIIPLKEGFFSLKIDRDVRLIFSVQKENIFITDVIYHSGSDVSSLPNPETLLEYEKLNPDIAKKMIELAEKEMVYRIEIEKKVIDQQLKLENLVFISTVLITTIGISACGYLFVKGQFIVAAIVFLVVLMPIVSRFARQGRK